MGSAEFNALSFEKRLQQLNNTTESIQALSSWCLKQRTQHKRIVASWLNVLKRVKIEQRLTLFYLANDVIQYSRRKNYDYVRTWCSYLQKAIPLVRDEKVRPKILRIFKIWGERSVYEDDFLTDLTGLLTAGNKKTGDDDALDFQPQQLVNKIRQCSSLEADTDLCLQNIHNNKLDLNDCDALCTSLKDRRHTDDVQKELGEGITCVEKYTQALQKEIIAREALLSLLKSANQYYSTQRGEVKVVALAYKSFGQRVRQLKRKLDGLVPKLPSAAPSPPRRDEDVPSPGPDEDIDLPQTEENDNDVSYNIDKTFNTSLTADGSLYNLGLSSFLNSENALKLFHEGANNNTTATVEPKQESLPGLDLLTPDNGSTMLPPPSFYGAHDVATKEEPEPYNIEAPNQWNNLGTWNNLPPVTAPPTMVPPTMAPSTMADPIMAAPTIAPPIMAPSIMAPPTMVPPAMAPPTMVPPVAPSMMLPPPNFDMSKLYADTPESPPPPAVPLTAPPLVPDTRLYTQELPSADVDHRGLLPPPPPPPTLVSLGQLEDVDHRLLPPPPPPVAASTRHVNTNKDVDHRNLISLTHQSSPQTDLATGIDQDYRVPPPLGPNDIVESVDMDLSEDEEQMQHMIYPNQHMMSQSQKPYEENKRRNSYNANNKVLVGGGTGSDDRKRNIRRINSLPNEEKTFTSAEKTTQDPISVAPVIPEALTAPPALPLLNPFDNKPQFPNPFTATPPPVSNNFQPPNDNYNYPPPNNNELDFDAIEDVKSNDDMYEGDLRTRGFDVSRELVRNPSPPRNQEYVDEQWAQSEWSNSNHTRNFMMNQPNPRFQRNWNAIPRPGFGPPGFPPQQFWPRNSPRTPGRPWNQRPRFW